MAIDTIDKLIASLGESQDQQLFLPSITTTAALGALINPATTTSFGKMAVPTAYGSGGNTYNQSGITTGFPRWTAGTGTTSYIARWSLVCLNSSYTWYLNDLYWAASGFSGTVTTAQNVSGFAGLPARAGTGVGAEIWISASSATGSTAANVTVTYTNSDGVSGRTTRTQAHPVSFGAYRMYQLKLQSDDKGVQSVQSLQFSGTTGTAGNVWVCIGKRITCLDIPIQNIGFIKDFTQLGMPEVSDEACLVFVPLCGSTSSSITMGQLSIIQG